MNKNSVVRARIDQHIKDEAADVLALQGLTVSDAIRITLTRLAQNKSSPFEPLILDPATIAAMHRARNSHVDGLDNAQAKSENSRTEDCTGRPIQAQI